MQVKQEEYVNADAIAAGLSPFAPESTAIQAGRLMLERIKLLTEKKVDFAFESTLASKTFVTLINRAKQLGYSINITFLWLHTPELAKVRVADRVSLGGHNIPEETVVRRYYRGIKNFFELYMPLADRWQLHDNSNFEPVLIAETSALTGKMIQFPNVWDTIVSQINDAK